MKKGFKIVGIIVLVFIIGVLVWCLVPTRFCNIDAQQVEKIEVFDGSRGVELEISEEFTINTEDDAKREIIYYKRAKGNLCYEYLDELAEKAG